jgi:hypothetical protein
MTATPRLGTAPNKGGSLVRKARALKANGSRVIKGSRPSGVAVADQVLHLARRCRGRLM